MKQSINVEVAYALPDKQAIIQVQLDVGNTAIEAIRQSRLLESFGFSASELNEDAIGIFGQKCAPDIRLGDGDRVEIYRPLLLSPSEARRLRARCSAEKRDT